MCQAKSQKHEALFWWNFDEIYESAIKGINISGQINQGATASARNDKYQIGGLTEYLPGVRGKAIKLDGFSSYIDVIPPKQAEKQVEFDLIPVKLL
jgi:hypothetical protein